MKNSSVPAFIISGTSSGSGKTTIALGLMAAFKAKGMQVQPFKCGPDFIDPGLHQLVTGTVSRNLDVWMSGEDFARNTFYNHLQKTDIAIVEGVMGMFDGKTSSSGYLSTLLNLTNVLVIDVRSMAESAAAIVKGFEMLDPKAAPKAIILNRIGSMRHLELVEESIKTHCNAEIVGYLPRNLEFSIPSRHLGLLTGDEAPIAPDAVELLAKTITEYVDLDRLLALCSKPISDRSTLIEPAANTRCRIGVARDKAFCFYYEDNFDLFRNAGAELHFFSPLTETKLPPDLDALYFGGGYPELYSRELSKNSPMIKAVSDWIEADKTVYAECGGFMYLTKGITDSENNFHPMVGCFPVRAKMQTTRASLGYREVQTTAASCFGERGTILRGHEFHYSKIDTMDSAIDRIYKVNNNSYEGYHYKKVLGGYMHLHFGYSPKAVDAFINYCLE